MNASVRIDPVEAAAGKGESDGRDEDTKCEPASMQEREENILWVPYTALVHTALEALVRAWWGACVSPQYALMHVLTTDILYFRQ